ncbi:virulence factor family protein [Mesorhizobium sp. IMUNJ 23033]|uniref:virulence factor family protein n=1 Tax=Mesorhizobium sp. IMUNJ 23033 TaxID=3378039 RepID=UPI00384A9663
MKHLWFRLGLAAIIGATAFTVYWMRPEPLPDTDTLAVADLVKPQQAAKGIVFLFSGVDGYSQGDAQTARELAAAGALVVGIDLHKSFAKVESKSNCVYFVSDIEELSQLIQRSAGAQTYLNPIIAGTGAGGSMVMAIMAQSPDATIGRAVAVDPKADLVLPRELCSDAPHLRAANGQGWIYGMQAGALPAPITVVQTPKADPAGQAHVSDLIAQGFPIDRVAAVGETLTLTAAVEHALTQSAAPVGDALADLPLAVLPAAARHDTMAIVLSGDGGWRDIDSEVGEALSQAGVPTVGIDSLRYFWTRKPPETIAADLTRIIEHFTKTWKVRRVALIGYSFGADALPAAYNQLSPAEKERVSLISLLALSRWAEFEFDVGGWLGMDGDTSHPTLPDVAKIPASILQCVYGADDDDSVCAELAGSGADVVVMDGGHHFDDDYSALANRIIARIR